MPTNRQTLFALFLVFAIRTTICGGTVYIGDIGEYPSI